MGRECEAAGVARQRSRTKDLRIRATDDYAFA
jgi:hypothetical protein